MREKRAIAAILLGSLLCCVILGGCASGNAPSARLDGAYPLAARSDNITPFYKWTDVLARLDTGGGTPRTWPGTASDLKTRPLSEMARTVDSVINNYAYIDDRQNWGQLDYWETPAEFFERGGGDCEGFAIAKYAWLRALGVPEDRLRLEVVYDRYLGSPHTLLTVYTESGPLALDNQDAQARSVRYKPLYSINGRSWWLPARA
jgi:predicted transglutaminase-like cysteine proteinase